MNIYNQIIFDVSNLFLRAWNSNASKDDVPQLASNMLKKIVRENAAHKCKLLFLCDNWGGHSGAPSERKQLDSQYKANRVYDNRINAGIAIFHEWLKTIPLSFIYREPMREADDLLPEALHEHCKEGFTLLVSADMDWACELSRKVHWHNFKKIFLPTDFLKEYGYGPTRISVTTHKAFRGDKSDNVPNANTRIDESDLLRIIALDRALPEILADFPEEIRDLESKLKKYSERLLLNWKLLTPLS